MKIDSTEKGIIRLKEVYNSIILETSEGNQFVVCMRDDGLEIGVEDVCPKGRDPMLKYYVWMLLKVDDIRQYNRNLPEQEEVIDPDGSDNGVVDESN